MSKIIPGCSVPAYARWELPDMDDPAPTGSAPPPPAPLPPVAPAQESAPEPSQPLPALPTLQEIEAIQREAQEEGYAAGYEEGHRSGYREGLAVARAEIKAQAEALARILDFMGAPLHELDAEVEDELVRLAVEIARQLVRRELKTARGEIVAVVREAVALLPVARPGLRVQLHPEDARLLREALDFDDTQHTWSVEEDPALTRGGCRVISEPSRIDATVEQRLGAVIATVLGDERGRCDGHT